MLAILFVCVAPAAAQYEPPPFEIYGGISLLDPDGLSEKANGGQVEITMNMTEKFALIFGIGLQKKRVPLVIGLDPFGNPVTQDINLTFSDVQTGFRYYAVRNERFSVFGHILTGGFFTKVPGLGNIEGGTFTPGGGVDINLTRKFAIRPFQVDAIIARGIAGNGPNIRYSAGVVYKFGD